MRVLAAIVAGLVASGCARVPEPIAACTQELRIHFTPAETTLVVGQAFTPSVELASCGGTQRLTDVYVWKVEDQGVASVNSATGRVTGRAPGETVVVATGARYGQLRGVRVVVRAVP